MTEQTKTPRTDLIVAELNIEPSESVRYARMERHATALERELATQSALLADMREALQGLIDSDDYERSHGAEMYAPGSPIDHKWKKARATLKRAADIGGA